MSDLTQIEAMQKAIKEIKALQVILPKVEPPKNKLSQNQIFGTGQMNMIMRVNEIFDKYNL